jgi:hydrogenase maturation protease
VATRTLIAGLGSPHGDDRAGWEVIEQLSPAPAPGVEAIALTDPSHLLDHLADGRLIVIDASSSGRPPGTIDCLRWPHPGLMDHPGRSSHGLGLGAILELAQRLGKLPEEIVLFAIEAASCSPGDDLSPAVAAALPEVCERVLHEIGG